MAGGLHYSYLKKCSFIGMVRAGILQISEQKLYRNLIESGGINRCGYQQKVKKGTSKKILDL
ncbi:hypothetical protein AIF77_07320 [Salmonella enterica subsp. enterica serovar Enteritidis]|nr:hypothetical protein [Salmonella enterica subsp. enterica serovar Enteritidis]